MEGTNQAQAALSEKTSKDNLVSLYLNANNSKVGQSFDFRDNPYPTAKNIDPKTELTFSVDLGKNIDRNSVCVVIYDGLKKVEIPLQTLAGNVFQHQFPQVTEEAYVWIYGNTDSSQFSYKVAIPVSGF
ncbi:hypothetical protein HYY75_03425 [bacterium]|nr:hypothetical protein [bacterium]